MIKLSDIKDDEYLIIEPNDYDCEVMTKKEFMQSSWYIDRESVKVSTTEIQYATFNLYYALECLEDDMYEDWLSNIMNSIPEDVRIRIEKEINGYLEKEPTYYPKEIIEW